VGDEEELIWYKLVMEKGKKESEFAYLLKVIILKIVQGSIWFLF